MPPPKPPLTAISEPDPIYPYLPFLFCSLFRNECATRTLKDVKPPSLAFTGLSFQPRPISEAELAELVHVRYKPDSTNERFSLGADRFGPSVDYGSALMNSSTSAEVL